MIDQLPRWVWFAGGALSFAAGLMNAVGLLAFGAEAVTHLTGTTTLLAGHVGFGRWDSALHLLGILLAFCVGAAFSGWLIRDEHLQLGRRYTIALSIVALLILAATQAFLWREHSAYYLLASAVGLQNAMATTFSGAVMRTSHVSGMFTDLAIYLGHSLRGLPVAKKRVAVCLLVIGGFSSGGLAGAIGMRWIGPGILLVAAAIAAGLALAHALRRRPSMGKV